MAKPIAILDFETQAIMPRPAYPPRPAGCAVILPRRRSFYIAWNHPVENNEDVGSAKRILTEIWKTHQLVFHNAKFDLDVAETHLKLRRPPPEDIHCTQILSFLMWPDSRRLGLKELAADRLGMPPDEQLELKDWILVNVPEARRKKKDWGAHIAKAPGRLVAKYAIGDVVRTKKLFALTSKYIRDHGMADAYLRKRRALYLLLRMEREGVPVNVEAIADAITGAEESVEIVDRWLRRRLGAPELEIDKDAELADALIDHECDRRNQEEVEWELTGKRKAPSVAIPALERLGIDPDVLAVLRYRSKLTNGLRTFARPWMEMAESTGRIFTIWNQIKSTDTGRSLGTRTGRLSSAPNFQNVPKIPSEIAFTRKEFAAADVRAEENDTAGPLMMPRGLRGKICPLINLRSFVIAETGQQVAVRDYSQQELRILGHFEGGRLCQDYLDNPAMDLHTHAQGLINSMLGTNFKRKPIKNTGFGIIYGMGLGRGAIATGTDTDTFRILRDAYKKIFPGVKDLDKELKALAKADEPLVTAGGRAYYCEPGRFSKKYKRWMTFEYKMLNTLVQGSAADCTEEAMLRYDEIAKDGRLLLQVHDELIASVAGPEEMKRLQIAMESLGPWVGGRPKNRRFSRDGYWQFKVPMLSDGKIGENWAMV